LNLNNSFHISMRLQDVKPRPGAKKRRKRIGCGESSGHGKTSGKGNKGQMARAGRGIRPGFEGGQMPMHRRLPRRASTTPQFQDFIEVVNVGELNEAFQDGAVINEAALREVGLVSRNCRCHQDPRHR
jgi:large subunit ribosomal protein L15